MVGCKAGLALLIVVLAIFSQANVFAVGSVVLAWDASADTNVVGYRVYFGGASGDYTNSANVGNVANATFNNLPDGSTYYFAAASYTDQGFESDYSNEISHTVPTANTSNLPPTLNVISNLSIDEDAGLQIVSLTGISDGSATESQNVTVTASSSNTGLIGNPSVTYSNPNTTGSLSFTPVANASGSALITVTVNDNQSSNNIVTQTFTVTVNPVNDAPTLAALANVSMAEDASAQTVNLTGISSGAANESNTLVITASSSNQGLIPNPTVNYSSPNGTGSLSFTPVAGANGSATITVTVNDGQSVNSTATRTFTVTVTGVNDAPTLAAISNVSVNEDSGSQTVNLTGIATGNVNETQTLTITASSSNTGLIPNPTVSYANPNTSGSISFTPVANASGSATISVTVNDGQAANSTVTQTFTVTVNPVNDAPTLAAISGRTIAENAGVQTVNLAGISTGATNETQTLIITATSSDTALIPNPTVNYASPNSTGSLSFTPLANVNGSATITVTVNDNQAANSTTTRTFAVTITSVNSAPTITPISDRTVVSDTSSGPIPFIIGDIETSASLLSVSAISSNPGILPLTNIVFAGNSSNRTVTVTPVSNSSGQSDVTITVGDGAASASTTFRVTATVPPPVTEQLSLNKTGSGTITPDLSSSELLVGQSYTVTATAAVGYIFTGWSGSVNSSSPTITFVMGSNTVLNANFVANPYPVAAGTYNGLFNQNDEVRLASAGAFNVYADANGNFSAWVQLAEGRYSFSGAFNVSLGATNTVARSTGNPLTVELHIGQGAEAGQITGRVSDGVWSSPLSGGRASANTTHAGDYTVVMPGNVNDSSVPAGDGFATLRVATDGLATLSGTLADGTRFSQSAYVTTDGDWPLFVPLYSGKGAAVSWLSFTNLSTSDLNGNVVWIKQAAASASSYQLGFTNGTKAVGSVYNAPDATGKAINLAGALVSFTGGSLPVNFNNVVSVNAGSQIVNLSANEMAMTIQPSLGSFTGQIREPGNGALHMFGGVILQKQTAGFGTMMNVPTVSRVVFAAP